MNTLRSFIIASLICLPFTQMALADTTTVPDSTDISAPGVKTVMPQTMVNMNNCVLSSKITAILVINSGGTTGGKGGRVSNCPTGYVAAGMKAYVGLGGGSGQYYWQTNCCQAYVGYPS